MKPAQQSIPSLGTTGESSVPQAVSVSVRKPVLLRRHVLGVAKMQIRLGGPSVSSRVKSRPTEV